MKILKKLAILAAIGVMALVAFLYSGIYPMGADVPHNALTYWALETLRERSPLQACMRDAATAEAQSRSRSVTQRAGHTHIMG